RERRRHEREQQAERLCQQLHASAALKNPDLPTAEKVDFMRRQKYPEKRAKTLRALAARLQQNFAETPAARKNKALIQTAGIVQQDMPLDVDPETLEKVMDELRKDNPKEFIDRSFKITEAGVKLNLSKLECVSNLDALSGTPLRHLNLANTGVKDLSPLKGLPLRHLDLSNTKAADLSPLAGMPLKSLRIAQDDLGAIGKVEDLSPLEGMPMKRLQLIRCGNIDDLTPLRGMPLESLVIEGLRGGAYIDKRQIQLRDLSPLSELPIKNLALLHLRVSDISALKDMPLENLQIEQCPVTDLSPLKGKAINHLTIRGTNIDDFSPLRDMNVETLVRN
ncbi:MAG: hypothetical protein ACOCWJ_02800, partial [Verrucomicrobiota bacterium]